VLRELRGGDYPGREDALALLDKVRRLVINREVFEVAGAYVAEKLMPGPAGVGDNLHLALASYHGAEFLLTWNIRHLANLNKLRHLEVINRRLLLPVPRILTPELLWFEET